MTNDEALKLAKLAWPGKHLDVSVTDSYGSRVSDAFEGDALLEHPDRALFEKALRALARQHCIFLEEMRSAIFDRVLSDSESALAEDVIRQIFGVVKA